MINIRSVEDAFECEKKLYLYSEKFGMMIFSVRRIFAIAILLCTASVCAQETDGEYYPFYRGETAPDIETDPTLFYLPAYGSEDSFRDLTDYTLSFVRLSRRGAAPRVELNGVAVNAYDAGALRRLLRSEKYVDGMDFSDFAAGGFAGTRSFDGAIELRRSAVSLAAADRSRRIAVRLYDARPLGRGWNYALSAAADGGRDARITGVFTRRLEAAAALNKNWMSGRLSVVVLAAPSERGLRSASSAEAFELTGDNLYNPSWGMQHGRVRNSRVRRELLPSVTAAAERKTGAGRLFATVHIRGGESAVSGLDWYDGRTPTPDNYRMMPSYFDSEQIGDAVAELWRTRDVRYTQIDWEELYARNAMAGERAVYVVEDRVEAPLEMRGAAGGEFRVARNTLLTAAFTGDFRRCEYFKRMRDLLGGEYIEDIDQYLVGDDRYGNSLVNDMRNPDRRVRRGDKFGYDYLTASLRCGARAMVRYRDNRLSVDAGVRVASASQYRKGLYEKQLFPAAGSFGRSRRVSGVEGEAKIAVSYAFSAAHRIGFAAAARREMVPIRELLLQPDYNNRTADADPIYSCFEAEAGYRYGSAAFSISVKAFAGTDRDRTRTLRFFDDISYAYADAVVCGVDILRYGVEAAVGIPLSSRLKFEAALSAGSYTYASNPEVSIYADTDNSTIVERAVSYMSGLHTAEAPTAAVVVRLCYSTPSGWRVSADAAYVSGRCVSPTPVRRLARVTDLAPSPEAFDAMVSQRRLDDALRVDLSVMKSWTIRGVMSRLTAVASVRNLTDDRSTVYSGYEPSRVIRSGSGLNISYRPMPERYTYAYPLSFYLSLTYKFQ